MHFSGNLITTVWVDLDDTLIDFTTNANTALLRMHSSETLLQRLFTDPAQWVETYERHNLHLWDLYARAEISRDYLRMERFRLPLTEAGLDDASARLAAERYDTLYLDYLAEERTLMPGALDLMKWLKRQPDIKVGCLSNGFKDVQFRKIRRASLEPYFDLVVLSDDIGVQKPDPRLYRYAEEQAGDTDQKHHLMIGDNPATDVGGALGAGWNAVWFHPLRAADAPCPEGATEIRDLAQLYPLLRG